MRSNLKLRVTDSLHLNLQSKTSKIEQITKYQDGYVKKMLIGLSESGPERVNPEWASFKPMNKDPPNLQSQRWKKLGNCQYTSKRVKAEARMKSLIDFVLEYRILWYLVIQVFLRIFYNNFKLFPPQYCRSQDDYQSWARGVGFEPFGYTRGVIVKIID